MHKGNFEDTSVNLFKKSATLDEAQKAEFAQMLFEKSAAKPHSDPNPDSGPESAAAPDLLLQVSLPLSLSLPLPPSPSLSFSPSPSLSLPPSLTLSLVVQASASVPQVKQEPGVGAERGGGAHGCVVAKIDFEAAANPPKAQHGPLPPTQPNSHSLPISPFFYPSRPRCLSSRVDAALRPCAAKLALSVGCRQLPVGSRMAARASHEMSRSRNPDPMHSKPET